MTLKLALYITGSITGRWRFGCAILFFFLKCRAKDTHTHTLQNQHLCQLAAALIKADGLERSVNP